ncbi:GGDEF domain-containing protein [Deinococcus radiotolerans]|uniref:Sensor histidine kinase n=1 Tax=Deinococcus radiotolerans TaxID=1309407 RepID=A0ABQ2FIS7_9DEIO|nr:diguanylate cyclase [Deinococcus radiotolerans]GGK99410.1 sensor histidine kinase [Deinococcus radiotolerans]
MPVRQSLNQWILLGILLPVLGLVTLTGLSLNAMHQNAQNVALQTRSQEALTHLRKLQILERQLILARTRPERQATFTTFDDTWRAALRSVENDPAQAQRLEVWRDRVMTWAAGDEPVTADVTRLAQNLPLIQTLVQTEEDRLADMRQATEQQMQDGRTGLLTSTAVLAGAALLMGLFVQRRLRTFVRQLHRATAQLEAGDLTTRLPTEGSDELADLATQFNSMVTSVAHTMASEQDLKNSLEARVEALVHASTHELQLLGQLGTFMQACRDQTEAAGVLRRIAPVIFPDGGSVALVDSSRRVMNVFAEWGDHSGVAAYGPDDCWSSRLGTAHETAEMHPAPRCPHDHTRHATTCIPLTAQGETLGVISLHFQTVEEMERARELAQRFADRVALSLANVRLKQSLREQSVRDALTGLYNRRHLDDVGERELAWSRRHGVPLSVLLLDIDHFKQFNDQHGHLFGDEVLRQVGAELERRVRTEDVLCRYGGEEFVLLMQDCAAPVAVERAETLRQAVQGLQVQGAEGRAEPVTVSIGVATAAPGQVARLDDLIRRADLALYRAKEAGRNRTEQQAS